MRPSSPVVRPSGLAALAVLALPTLLVLALARPFPGLGPGGTGASPTPPSDGRSPVSSAVPTLPATGSGAASLGPSAVATPEVAVIVGAGDIADCDRHEDEATAALLDGLPGTVFTAGDNAYDDGTREEYDACYGPTWGRHLDRTRPTPGNHDHHTDGAAGYFDYFGDRAGPDRRGWYAWDAGSWRILALDSDCLVSDCASVDAQLEWLRAELAADTGPCVAAIYHHPRFSSGEHGDIEEVQPIWELLAEGGVDVVVNGHDHSYERFAPLAADGSVDPDGIRLFVSGTGGARLRSFLEPKPGSEVRSADAHGVLELTLGEGEYAWRFVPVAGKTFTDTGTGVCR